MDTIVEKLKSEIASFVPIAVPEDVGTVLAAGDGIAEIDGLSGVMMGELVQFEVGEGKPLSETLDAQPIAGLALNLEDDVVRVVVLGDATRVRAGMSVRRSGEILSIGVGEALIGRVVDALGTPVDGGSPLKTGERSPIERKAFGVIERKSVLTPLHTGWKAVDGMIPIGRGQRELIIGDRQTGKTTLAIDAILNQKNEAKETRPICIYVAIGQKESKVARIVHELKEAGAMDYTIVVSAPASAPAAMQFLAPYAGAAIGEYFMLKGKDALIIYDDLSKHAVAYRQMSLLLRRPPGREAYPGDIFYLHSRLLERAARLSDTLGGGSLTALPIIETQEGDVSAYIPTNVISITDGQIYLESDLFNKGIRPGINVGISVSRVGSSAQTKAMKKVAGRLRLDLAQFRELEAFVQFASDLDPETKKKITRGKLMVEVLKQDKRVPLAFERQVAILYVATQGLMDLVPEGDVVVMEGEFLSYLETAHGAVLDAIRTSRDVTPEVEVHLREAFAEFRGMHPQYFPAAVA